MITQSFLINARDMSAFFSLTSELTYNPDTNYLFDLSHLSALRIQGEHAQDFLQGQLSCDLREVHERQMQRGALCNLKGRVLALMDVVLKHPNDVHLVLPRDLLSDTERSLAKQAIFSRVQLSQTSDTQWFGFHLQNPNQLVPWQTPPTDSLYGVSHEAGVYCYHLGQNFYVLGVEKSLAKTLQEPFIHTNQWRGALAWHALQLQQQLVQIYPESRGLFLPHRIGLHLTGYLNFNKGCYRGQEIIARTHFRATLKHTLQILTLELAAPPQSGHLINSVDPHMSRGEVIDYCPIGNHHYLIATSMPEETR